MRIFEIEKKLISNVNKLFKFYGFGSLEHLKKKKAEWVFVYSIFSSAFRVMFIQYDEICLAHTHTLRVAFVIIKTGGNNEIMDLFCRGQQQKKSKLTHLQF